MSQYQSSTVPFDVAAYSYQDTYSWYSSAYGSVDYDRVVGLEIETADSVELVGEVSEEYDKNSYELTGVMINGLRLAMSRIALKEHINCNLFSRLLDPDYVDLAVSNPLGESWHPIAKYSRNGEQTEVLEKGQVGTIVIGNRGSVHSLVGLDAKSDLSIQVMSHGGELAILTNKELLRFYRDLNPETDVELYARI